MNKSHFGLPIAAGCLFLAATVCSAADTSPAEKPSTADAEMSARIKRLEKRIEDLEAQLNQRGNTNNGARMGQWRSGMDSSDNVEDLLNQMGRELQDGFGDDPQTGPKTQSPWGSQLGPRFQFRGPFGRGNAIGEKPRLGVELQPVTDELRERYKNDVKQGAFVVSVVHGSAAEKAGVMAGDAITKIAGNEVADAQAAMDAIHAAPKGKLDLVVTRQGKNLQLSADLAEAAEDTSLDNFVQPGPGGPGGNRWLRRGDLNRGGGGTPPANGSVQTRTELKASALEMSDELANALKLSDEQRKTMAGVLQKETQAASDEASASSKPQAINRDGRDGGFNLDMSESANIGKIVDKHVTAAETALKDTLSAGQMSQWNDFRKTHSSIQFSHSMSFEGGETAPGAANGQLGF